MLKKKYITRYETPNASTFSEPMHPVLQKVLLHRNVTDLKELRYTLDQLLPFDGLLDINKAVDILIAGLKNSAHILILGDFDADGATSTALAVSALTAFGAENVSYLVPNRFEYGYGLTPEIVDVAALRQPHIIMTVDNGISSCAGVLRAKQHGMQVIITDHHLPGAETPQADAIVNPNQHGDVFKSKSLAGVGVIFYLMWALRNRLHERDWFNQKQIKLPNLSHFLDLVALGTVADLAPLDYNNRILVQQGLQRIRKGQVRPGIAALLEIANRNPSRIVASDLGFAIGPRLNAAGRLDDMSLGIECLLTQHLPKAREIAKKLDQLNMERRLIENDMQQQADHILATINLDEKEIRSQTTGICLYHEDWHQGVIGILASRVKDKLHRPVIAFANANDNETLKGSARSIPGLHIRDTLDAIASQYPELIEKFGGHAQAAGLQIASKNFPRFCKIFDELASEKLTSEELTGKLMSDGELLGEEFSLKLAYLLRDTTPWGQHFSEPLFDGQFKVLEQRLVGDKHLKLTLLAKDYVIPLHAIAFNVDVANWPNHDCEYIHAAYHLDVNEYQGQQSLQLIIDYLEKV